MKLSGGCQKRAKVIKNNLLFNNIWFLENLLPAFLPPVLVELLHGMLQ